ncbi:MAG: FAD-dependent oxidoreductase [Phycisphaeraceae bacterium]
MPRKTNAVIHEPARDVPVIGEYDVCVLGGSCTGVFAAVRAARLGARVVLVEKAGCFGGVATLSLVNVWHSPLDEAFERPIIGGLTLEVMQRLERRAAVKHRERSPHWAWAFNPAEMQIELDELVTEAGVEPMLHTSFVAPYVVDGRLDAAIVENKSGRGALRARQFIDATGDADLCHRLGLETYTAGHLQPATTCATLSGWSTLDGFDLGKTMLEHGATLNLPQGFAWGTTIPGSDVYMLAGTRIYHTDCSDAAALTRGEIEGRRQVRAITDLIRQHAPQAKVTLQTLPARIGIRETRHVRCHHQLTGDEILHGHRFDDAIANGSYRVDIHHQDKPGITLRYLDGREEYCCPGQPNQVGRWREETSENPTFYQIPYRSMLPRGPFDNVLVAGRMIDADPLAHAAIRVMVNMNQTGEAAGVAAWQALDSTTAFPALPAATIRKTLAAQGSVMID